MAPTTSVRVVEAAGAVVWRKLANAVEGDFIELLLIHRPKYDDWTFPKGKRDRGESLQMTSVREVAEETGLRVRLGVPLESVEYQVDAGVKTVNYWSARPVGSSAVEDYVPNDEVDVVRWVRLPDVDTLLTYEHDAVVLQSFLSARTKKAHKTRTLIILRHAEARSRLRWKSDDIKRPLTAIGTRQATRLVGPLAAYGIRDLVSSDAVRCAQTVEPYARSISTFLSMDSRLLEDAKVRHIRQSVQALLEHKKPVVACTHRPDMTHIFAALRLPDWDLKPSDAVVVHHRKGEIMATELLSV
ncbi:MAG: hydrolase [Nocardioidaceae bacterium]|nr:hydrolase [Nocardioidaceae bacterium]